MVNDDRAEILLKNSMTGQLFGPLIFFDQAGPAEMLTGNGIDGRTNPHIGLGTVT